MDRKRQGGRQKRRRSKKRMPKSYYVRPADQDRIKKLAKQGGVSLAAVLRLGLDALEEVGIKNFIKQREERERAVRKAMGFPVEEEEGEEPLYEGEPRLLKHQPAFDRKK